jgi:hypothetical protein
MIEIQGEAGMPHVNQVPPDDSERGRRAYERRYLRALEGWVSSCMRNQALKRRNAWHTPTQDEEEASSVPAFTSAIDEQNYAGSASR